MKINENLKKTGRNPLIKLVFQGVITPTLNT